MSKEDERLHNIRHYRGKLQDFKSFMKSKENETNQPAESKIDIEKY